MLEHPEKKVYITGHSLGGALAILAAYDLAQLYATRTFVIYTFGCPRIGNHVFSDAYAKVCPWTYRIANESVCVSRQCQSEVLLPP